jgi:uncharacterized membrane protein YhiD involved in acid resistance
VPEFLTSPFSTDMAIAPVEVATRLVIAVLLGGVVAWIYKTTRGAGEYIDSFPPTLVLLSVLIAMVLQVIGDSVARAFSLVGALSVVRFRTVVRDTQDTAFVIFAVVVGMATGASDARVALIGIVVVGAAAFVMRKKTASLKGGPGFEPFELKVRLFAGTDVEQAIGAAIDANVVSRRLTSVSTAKQRSAIDAEYIVTFRPGKSPDSLILDLNRIDNVQSVDIKVRAANGGDDDD